MPHVTPLPAAAGRLRALLLGAALAVAVPRPALSQDTPLLAQNPALSATDICFEFGGDIWVVARAGGDARRLTAPPGRATGCQFSPDGRTIAYTGVIDNNADVYVIPTAGGAARRLTYNPASDLVRGWTTDGKVIFESDRQAATRGQPRLYLQSLAGGLPVPVDLPTAWDGVFSPDGKRLAYLPFQPANEAWKDYRGGQTTPIWIATLADAAIERVPRENSTDRGPMWVGDAIYFLSDRDGPTTLYAYDLGTHQVSRRIENHGLDIKSASAGPGGIVYEQFGGIRLYEPATGRDVAVPIRVASELTQVRPQWVSVSGMLQHPALSPTGARAAFEARGEILTVPAKKGDARNITQTTDATERWPAWSPDGQTLAYFSDAGGAYHLELRGQNGMGQPRRITLGGDDTYYFAPVWSPDGKRIAYTDSRGGFWTVEIATGKATRFDAELFAGFSDGGTALSWSPDSRWLAYARSNQNHLSAIFVCEVATGAVTRVTDGMSDARYPAFDRNGKYLYFAASTDAGPAMDFSMTTYDHPVTRSVYAIVLRKGLPSPLAPESDEEKAPTPEKAGKSPGKEAGKGAPKDSATSAAPSPVRIDFEAIDQRTVALPAPPRDYVDLRAGKEGIVILAEGPIVPVDQQGDGAVSLALYKLSLADRKTDPLLSGVNELDVSRNGENMLVKQQDKWTIAPIGESKPGEGVLATSDLQVATDPRAEWQEMYHEAFRLQRAYFYDPNYHGLDLAATERLYARYLDGLGSRSDLDYLLRETFGNLTVGHLFVFSGGGPPSKAPRNGALGADYAIENGRYRFARVYAGESWNPQFRAPLTQAGVDVHAGEYLLAVNGKELTAGDDVDHALEGTADKAVVLRVGPNADGSGARDVTVVPLASERQLRHLDWVDRNRRTVERLSGGKLAYLYMPNTANEGYARFNRYFFAQQDKQGAIVDERFNGGGNIADYMVNYLAREAPFNYITSRYGQDVAIPAGAIYGPKVMLINEYAGSGGDELPWLFRRLKVGPLVGKRTWGGLVGIGGYPTLMDGGSVTAPRVALWTPEGEYAVENRGVAPDVDVDLDPAAWRAGHDTQLERAVAIAMDALAKRAPTVAKRPPFPTWAKGRVPGGATLAAPPQK